MSGREATRLPGAATAGVNDAENLARVLPDYLIGAELGRGGYGVVLAAVHKQLGRDVAIKELPPTLATDPGVRARFVAVARLLASLDHPHIVPVHDFVEQDGVCALVMEAIPGDSVWGRFSDHGYTPSAACAVVLVACTALHHAHQHGVLHRDLTPENLLLTETGQLAVTGFGMAKVLGDNDALATTNGEILGTPAYLAPEQAQGREVGPQADVFAAGVILYELLSGKLPFSEEGGGLGVVHRHVYEQPIPLLDVAPTVPPALAAVVMTALSTAVRDRYPNADAFGAAIEAAATAVFGSGWFEEPAPDTSGAPPIRPVSVAHARRAAVEASPEAVVPIRQLLAISRWPIPWAVLTAALMGLIAVLALTGVGGRTARPVRGALVVAGQDASALPVVDLSKPFELGPVTLPAAQAANQVVVDLAVAGLPLVSSSVGKPGADGGVPVDARGARYLAAGTIQAKVSFRRNGTDLTTVTFPLRTKRSAFASVPGIAAIIALLLVLSYAQSQLAPLRRRRRWSSLFGLAFAGAILGGLAAVFAWLTSSDELLTSTLTATAAAGAVAGVLLGATTYKAGRRSRLLHIVRKSQLVEELPTTANV